MKNLLFGETVDDCAEKIIKNLQQRKDCEYMVSDQPINVCLTNPLARFSYFLGEDPAIGVVLGIAAIAGINVDDALSEKGVSFKPFLQGPCIRGFNSESKPYHVTFKNSGARTGSVDQLANAVSWLKENNHYSFVISLLDPKKGVDGGSGIPVSLNFFVDGENGEKLNASVYTPVMDVSKHFLGYIAPVYTFIQQITAMILRKKLGRFYVLSDKIYCTEDVVSDSPSIRKLKEFKYSDNKAFDLRYLDMAVQYAVDFFNRVRKGDLFVENPFKNTDVLTVFYDYCEAYRYSEANKKSIVWEEKPDIRHPQLSYYYDLLVTGKN